ncbi:DNA polymerase delta subunit 4 [Podospora conica]|nr:DNA polymerase delta subunit 4 [Schizothecium conicum]
MPATRKSSRLSAAGAKQSTLSFNHRVTKNVVAPGKKDVEVAAAAAPSSKLAQEIVLEESEPEVEEATDKSEAERRAAKISDRAIKQYWAGIEASRRAKAVHRKHVGGLGTGEKVLRYFDVSSQYGPCIGITRLKRWQRAERLGLCPPIEVLAVLLKEEAEGNKEFERAHMDELMNSTCVGGV